MEALFAGCPTQYCFVCFSPAREPLFEFGDHDFTGNPEEWVPIPIPLSVLFQRYAKWLAISAHETNLRSGTPASNASANAGAAASVDAVARPCQPVPDAALQPKGAIDPRQSSNDRHRSSPSLPIEQH
ncbi:hypothetical protein CGRA01v4_07974 [Colletotrichum graminicola]|uniref:Uncharacterized protein n=1 Tax=Colletotrichum graminicola (strain M1.001 / M2 / FGSC 10212) TaxID=645133 RepID=E3Q7W5_COLGM|nr:uncharacterized protein GLRG_02148 [Colletotrichum graminicola M1.001]EFQ26977.1 hypothetical protein GLRG_02148 [Colletotrichum graminicola M1.001]WDK16691.1 hypothetical protein CGRA01v4_07974 [Colletotrichum graminicola]